MTSLFSSASPPVEQRLDRDPPDDDHDRQHVERLGQPVPGVGERDHWFAAERR